MTRWRRDDDAAPPGGLSVARRELIESYKPDLPAPLERPLGRELESETAMQRAALEESQEPGYSLYELRVQSAPPTAGERPRRPRGRPPGRKQRRQVHFHVDPDEDRLLLEAARHFGSQQKGLVAALHALHEVLELRQQVTRLQDAYERQRILLAEAEALFNNR